MASKKKQASSSELGHIPTDQEEMLSRIGHVTRSLHNTLTGDELENVLGKVATDIPTTRDRLHYVTKMTEEAADKVLNATDAATPLQTEIADTAAKLEEKWAQSLASGKLSAENSQQAQETLDFLKLTAKNTAETKALIMEVVLAQDFQDLTGQVINKITTLAEDLETQLVQVLVDFAPESQSGEKKHTKGGLMNGPQINSNAENIVTDQAQVDDLLDNLGF